MTPARDVKRKRCKVRTKDKKRCSRYAVTASGHCEQHGRLANRKLADAIYHGDIDGDFNYW